VHGALQHQLGVCRSQRLGSGVPVGDGVGKVLAQRQQLGPVLVDAAAGVACGPGLAGGVLPPNLLLQPLDVLLRHGGGPGAQGGE
jgi:hypothetical protein